MFPSGEVRMVPESPTVTISPFPLVTPMRYSDVPEVLSVQVVPSEEVRMVPFQPTVTNDTVVLSVLVVLDVLLLQEMMVKLKRNNEKMMSRCLTWFPIGGLG